MSDNNSKVTQVMNVLKGQKISDLTDKHYLLALKLVLEELVQEVEKSDDNQILKYLKNRISKTSLDMGDNYFANQSDLYIMLSAYEAIITHLNNENKTFTKFVLNENINR